MITSKDAIKMLNQNGFRIPNGWGAITYNGERVGTLYVDEIYIASEFPHLRKYSYRSTKKQEAVRLDSSCARSDLEDCIQVLFKSPAAFEEEMREERVKKVKSYFDERIRR
jgi:hypothetical protein